MPGTRTRCVYCRISNEEFEQLLDLGRRLQLRTVSEVVRTVLREAAMKHARSEGDPLGRRLDTLERAVDGLVRHIRNLTAALEPASKDTSSSNV